MRQAYDAANASVALRDAGAIGGVALNNPGSRPRTKFGRLLRGKRMDSLMKEVKGYGVLPGHLDKKIEFCWPRCIASENGKRAGGIPRPSLALAWAN